MPDAEGSIDFGLESFSARGAKEALANLEISHRGASVQRVTIAKVNARSDREAWLELRRRHLTATDWPKLTGTSRWGSAEDVIANKQGCSSEERFAPSLPMRVGTDLEPLILKRAMKLLGPGEYLSQEFISRKHLGFTPDLVQVNRSSEWVLVEIKVSVKEWNGEVPPDYLDQVRFQATVLGLDQVQLIHLKLSSWQDGLRIIRSGLLPEEDLTRYLVDVDEAERRHIEQKADRWWKLNIETGI